MIWCESKADSIVWMQEDICIDLFALRIMFLGAFYNYGGLIVDIKYMERAIDLAIKGIGKVNPNPLVGAVIVKDDQIIGEGYHEFYGGLHAEQNAIKNLTMDASGAEMYVNLEPCCHQGKQPPCAPAIVASGIKKVYIGSEDPNELVTGKGIAYLREHGVEVVTNVLKKECDEINKVFFYYITTKMPYIVMKFAETLDGKMATHTGASRWITGEVAREYVHYTRNKLMGIMVGIGTVLNDDPLLTCRIDNGRNPIRIVCDTKLFTPLDSQIVTTAKEVKTYIATCSVDENLKNKYREFGIDFLQVDCIAGHIDLVDLMRQLGELGIDSILLEGGGTLNYSALKSGIIKEVHVYIAPKIFGGAGIYSPVGGEGVELPDQAFLFQKPKIMRMGDDILIEYEVKEG